MRLAIVTMSLAVTACGSEPSAAPPPTAAAAETIDAGEWETASEVTELRSTDGGTPVLATPVGTKGTGRLCVADGERARPDPALFMGEDYACTYKDFYMKGGTINATLACTRKGWGGEMQASVIGDFTADSFTAKLEASTALAGSGDFALKQTLTGRRLGPCPAT